MKRRGGYTLIETLAVITLLSATLIPIAAVMHTLYRADHRLQDRRTRELSVERLREQLRLDAHVAATAKTEEATLTLSSTDGRTVQYAAVHDGLERTVSGDNQVKHTELYRLQGTPAVGWQVHSSDELRLVTLQLDVTSGRPEVRNTYQLEAALRLLP